MSSIFTLSELTQMTGVARSTVQFYSRKGLLPPPAKTATGRCLYSEAHAHLLKFIGELRESGYSVAEVKQRLRHEIEQANETGVDLATLEYERVRRTILRAGIEEFVDKGYENARLLSIMERAGTTPYTFYVQFKSKAQLLVECLNAFVKWNAALVEPQVAGTSDPVERHLYRLTSTLLAKALAADVLMVIRMEGQHKDAAFRRPLEEAWGRILGPLIADLDAMRPQPSTTPAVPDELVAFGLYGAFDAMYIRSSWDDTFGLVDLLSVDLWLFLAIQAVMSGEIDIGSRLVRYDDLIRKIATDQIELPSSFDEDGYEPTHGRILHTAITEFVANGYQATHVSKVTQEAAVTPHVFYARFGGKARLLAECFAATVKWWEALSEPQVAHVSDPVERHLRRLMGTVYTHALGADVLALARVQGTREEGDLREPLEKAWGSVVRRLSKDLAAMRPQRSSAPDVPDELVAFSLLGAFDSIYTRSMWDDGYTVTDLLSAHLWLFLVVQAAMSGEIDVTSRLASYGYLLEEVAIREADATAVFEDS